MVSLSAKPFEHVFDAGFSKLALLARVKSFGRDVMNFSSTVSSGIGRFSRAGPSVQVGPICSSPRGGERNFPPSMERCIRVGWGVRSLLEATRHSDMGLLLPARHCNYSLRISNYFFLN